MIIKTDQKWVEIVRDKIDVTAADAYLRSPNVGGISIFVGTTREWTDDRHTIDLSYEAYESMALSEMSRLVDRAGESWPVVRACLFHRLGRVGIGEASVVVGVATAHRADSFLACRFLIDQLKVDVPIWKKEQYSDGHSEWVDDPASD